jgi:hypothetical protein
MALARTLQTIISMAACASFVGASGTTALFLLAVPLWVQAAAPTYRCSEQTDDAQRLACYDAEFGKPSKTTVRPAVAVAAPATKRESIASLRRMADGRYQATLENGEVWEQQEPDPRTEMRVGDLVTVRPAALGSFMLVTAVGARTRVTRVK